MVNAADHRSAGTAARIGGIILIPLAATGTAVFLADRYVSSLGIPGNALWVFMFPALFLVLGPVMVYWSGRHYHRAASMARIEAAGIPAWARFEEHKRAKWHCSRESRCGTHFTNVDSSVHYLYFTVHAQNGAQHRTIAEDHLPRDEGINILCTSWVPLLLDPEDSSLAAVQWDGLSSSAL